MTSKKIFALVLALALCLPPSALARPVLTITEAVPCKYAQLGSFQDGLALVQANWGTYGYIDTTGREVIPCQYDSAEGFRDGLATIRKGEQWGVIDTRGRTLFPECDFLSPLGKAGWIGIHHDGKMGVIDKTGTVLLPPIYDYISCVYFVDDDSGDTYLQLQKDGKTGIADKTGAIVVPLEYDYALSISDGLIVLSQNGKASMFNCTSYEILPTGYDSVNGFYGGVSTVTLNGKHGLIDVSGREIIPPLYDYIDREQIPSGEPAVAYLGKAATLFDIAGNVLGTAEYDALYPFHEGLALVRSGGKYGYIDQTGKAVIPLRYDGGDSFDGGIARVKLNGLYGFVDKTGKTLVPCVFEDASLSFSEGLSGVKKDGKWGYIDQTGNTVIHFLYDRGTFSIDPRGEAVYDSAFHKDLARVQSGGKWGYIDKTGKVIVPLIYEYAGLFDDTMALVRLNGKAGLVSRAGDIALPPEYDEVGYDGWGNQNVYTSEGLTRVKKGNRWGLLRMTAASVPSVWAKDEVEYAILAGLVPENLQGSYEEDTTRAEFCVMASRLYERKTGLSPQEILVDTDGLSPFSDTDLPEILACQRLGIVQGDGNGLFHPNGKINREQAATLLAYTAKALGADISAPPSLFPDAASIHAWANPSVDWVAANGIMTGTDKGFDPLAPYTREQSFITIGRLWAAIGGA